jgi:hypothetical protein
MNDKEINFIKLILRSPDSGDGWRNVSIMLWRLVEDFDKKELIENEQYADGSGRVRLSPLGLSVVNYII